MILLFILLSLAFDILQQLLLLLLLLFLLVLPLPLQHLHLLGVVQFFQGGSANLREVESFNQIKIEIFSRILILQEHDILLFVLDPLEIVRLSDHLGFTMRILIRFNPFYVIKQLFNLNIFSLSNRYVILILLYNALHNSNTKINLFDHEGSDGGL